MIVELLLVLGGLALLVLGGDLLVKGAVGLSHHGRDLMIDAYA